jgi:lipopolysaccharide export system protein LptA
VSRWPSSLLLAAAVAMLAAGFLPPVPPALAQTPPGAARLPVEVTGATLIEYDDAAGVLRAEGTPVVFTRGQTVVRAPRLRYDTRARTVTASGGVEVAEPGLSLRAQDAELRLADDRIRMSGDVRVRRVHDDGTMTLSAALVEGSLATRRFMASGAVTVARDDWTVSGRRMDYDDSSRVAVVTGDPAARLKDATMTAQTITVMLADERAKGEGGVVLRRGDLVGRAPRVDISRRGNLAVLSGGAQVDRGNDRMTADVIEVDLDGTRATARGGARVIFSSP